MAKQSIGNGGHMPKIYRAVKVLAVAIMVMAGGLNPLWGVNVGPLTSSDDQAQLTTPESVAEILRVIYKTTIEDLKELFSIKASLLEEIRTLKAISSDIDDKIAVLQQRKAVLQRRLQSLSNTKTPENEIRLRITMIIIDNLDRLICLWTALRDISHRLLFILKEAVSQDNLFIAIKKGVIARGRPLPKDLCDLKIGVTAQSQNNVIDLIKGRDYEILQERGKRGSEAA